MIKDAEAHADEDRRRKEAVELRNQADTLAYQTDKTLKEHGDKLDAATRAEVEQALSDLRTALDGDDDDAVRQKMEALGAQSQKLAQAIYESSADQAEATGEEPADDDDVVDAEVVDEGDDQQAAG
jgi:molecular chaperone DnaK